MSERPESADETIGDDDNNQAAEGALWLGVSGLVWALGISLLLHSTAMLPFLVGEFTPSAANLDVEWARQMEELRGIGHGREQERWAQLEERGEPRSAAKEEAEEAQEEVVEEPESDDETEEEAPEPEEAIEEAPSEPEEPVDEPPALAEKIEPKPAPKTPAAEDAPKKDVPNDKPPASDKLKKKVAQKSSPFDAQKPMPGVERGGPSAIPSLKNYGPGNAAVTALVRLDRVRGTLYEDNVRKLMQKVPDFRILAGHTGVDPIRDLDSFFMASARPQYIQESFLAVRHSMSEPEIKGVLDRRFRVPIPWQKSGGAPMRPLVPSSSGYKDPRRVLLARPGLAVVGKDKWLDEIAQNLAADSPLREQEGDTDAPVQATMLDGLAQIERVADGQDTMVLMSAQGLVYMIPGLGRMKFEGVSLKVSNPASPTTNIDLKFKDAVQAERFANSCPRLKGRLKKALGLDGFAGMAMRAAGLGDVIDKVKCRADAEYVNINLVLSAQQMRTLAGFGASFMPNPRVLSRLPPPPLPPAPAGEGDAGVGEGEGEADEVDAGNSANGRDTMGLEEDAGRE